MEGLFPEVGQDQTWAQVLMQTGLYGYVLSIAANMIGDGAELLLLVPSMAPLVGSIVLPILGAVPDGMMVLCSGLGPGAQENVSVGVGALAGSTIMLLTLPWFLALNTGRVTIKNGQLCYSKPQGAGPDWVKLESTVDRPLWQRIEYALFFSGIGIGDALKQNAKYMVYTATSYLVIQLPSLQVDEQGLTSAFHNRTDKNVKGSVYKAEVAAENPWAWVGLFMTLFWFFWYLYQMWKDGQSADGAVQDQITKQNVKAIQEGNLTLRGAMLQFRQTTWDTLCAKGGLEEGLLTKGSAAEDEVKKMCKLLVPFFRQYDQNGDQEISMEEFRLILNDLGENISGDVQKKIFDAADMDNSGSINFEEFVACMMAFALDPNDSLMNNAEVAGVKSIRRMPTESAYMQDGDEQEEDGPEEEDMPEDLADLSPEEQQSRIKTRSFSTLFWGTALVLLFSDPMTDMLGVIGNKMGVNPFYISFIFAPLASNASELVSSMKLAVPKTQSSMVQALATLEGAAIMNNSFCLAIFLILIIWKGLVWEFTAETVSILFIQLCMAYMVLFKQQQTLFDGCIIMMFYPGSLVIVYLMELYGLD